MRSLKGKPQAEIPYPAVFHDWLTPGRRVATGDGPAGVEIEMYLPGLRAWQRVELTENDACLMAASLLRRAGREDLATAVLRGIL